MKKKKQDLLNQMWRNPCLNDTYEPGSTFKIITMGSRLAEGVVSLNDLFTARDISWWRTGESTVRTEEAMEHRIL